jgi:hypothetical protein
MKLTQQIICDIIKNGLSLKTDQIWIHNQRRHIPEDKRLYITVGMLSSKPYGNNISYDYSEITGVTGTTGVTGNAYDVLDQYVKEIITIDLFSYTTEALERYGEVLGSLRSSYSEEVQTDYCIRIAKIPLSINDISHVEGMTVLNRKSLTLQVLRKYSNILTTNYYDLSTQNFGVTGQ